MRRASLLPVRRFNSRKYIRLGHSVDSFTVFPFALTCTTLSVSTVSGQSSDASAKVPHDISEGAKSAEGNLRQKMEARGFTRATENFSPDLLSGLETTNAAQQQQSMEDFAAGIDTTIATNIDLKRDLFGPWLIMAENIPALQGGELFVDTDGFVFYRPANGLGYGIGRIEVITADRELGTAFLMDVEVYQFAADAQRLPRSSTSVKISGVVNSVHSKSTNYTTFSLLGAWEPAEMSDKDQQGDGVLAGAFHAAKIMPWDATAAERPWEPNKEIVRAFKEVFPSPLQLNSHLRRQKEAKTKVQNDPEFVEGRMGYGKRGEEDRPLHLDLAPYRIAPQLSELYYIPQYISTEEEAQIVHCIQQTPEEFKSKLKKRTCQEWGCTMCDVCEKSFVSDANTPLWVQQTTDMLVYDGIFTPSTFPNSVRVHEYQSDEGIGPHSDGPIYVPLVTVLSGASTSVMHFYPRTPLHGADPLEHYRDTFKFKEGPIGSKTPMLSVVLEPRSLLIFAGDCYYDYPHGISDDPVIDLRPGHGCGEIANQHLLQEETKSLEEIKRSYRVSLTTRNLLPRCSDQPRRAEYAMKRAWYLYHQKPVPEPLFASDSMGSGFPSTAAATPGKASGGSFLNHEPSLGASPTPLSPQDLQRWEAKLDRILSEHQEIKAELHKVRELLTVVASTSTHYQNETSGILNHLSTTLLDVQSKVEDTIEIVEENSTKEKPT